MSSIQKMAIQGIRSFGPDDSDEQVIEFSSPLTLILGPNGTGKTTIIECLKYMTTGNLPPGGKQNAAFIHDPKVAGDTEVQAQIQLWFQDVQGHGYTVARRLTATQKAKKVEMRTSEGLITRSDMASNEGNQQIESLTCADMTKKMVFLLGVSRPILDSVIFCHQEEANWPLSEGKALKTKFDDIFASTRYVKALEVIKKCRLEQEKNEIKDIQTHIKYLKENKDKAAELKANLDEQKPCYLASKDIVADIKEKMEPIMKKLDRLRSQREDIYEQQTRIEKMKSERDQIEKSRNEIQQNIKNQFTGSTTELKKNLQDFADQVKEQQSTLKINMSLLESLDDKLRNIRVEKSDHLVKQGELQQEEQRHQITIEQRDGLVEKVAEKYNLSGFKAPLSKQNIEQFLKHMEVTESKMEEKLLSRRAVHEKEECHVQTKIEELKKSETKLRTEIDMKLETFDKNQEDIQDITLKLNHMNASGNRLKGVQQQLRRVEQDSTDAEKAVDLESLKIEADILQKDKNKMDGKMKTLETELNRLLLESTARNQLDSFREERTSKTNNICELKSEIEDSVTRLIGKMPTENLRCELDRCTSKLNQSVQSTNSELQTLLHKKTTKETESKMQNEQLTTRKDKLREIEERLNNISSHQTFDDDLSKLQADLRKAQDEKGHLKSIDYLYRDYKKTLGEKEPPCPLCDRHFQSHAEVDKLVDQLSSKLSLVPAQLKQVEMDIESNQRKVDEMIELKPFRTEMVKLDSQIIPQLKKDIKSLVDEMERLSTDINEKEDVLKTYSAKESTAQSMLTDAAMIDKLQSELKDIDRKIAQQSSCLSGGDSDRSVNDVQKEREEIQADLENVNRNLDCKRQKISEHSDRVQQLRSTLIELKGEKLQIESALQQRNHLEKNLVTLESANDTLDREVKESKQEIKPVQVSISDQEKHKQQIIQEKDKHYEEGMTQINSVKEHHRKVVCHNQDIEDYFKNGKDKLVKENSDKMDHIEGKAKEVNKERESVLVKINQTKEDLGTQKVRERELTDSLLVRKKKEELDNLGIKITELESKLGGIVVNNLNRQIKDMEAELQQYIRKKKPAERRQIGLEEEIKHLRRELNTDQYREAGDKYREKLIDLRTTELAIKDLEKYHKALYKAILAYHSTKMADINKIIRELWRNTYKGNDIETIEICTDVEEQYGASNAKQTYNYRVVMKKGNSALDMRNRCSAGQKVLASLIIRLALAETFCLNCGILALDEPTTNLDRENIESLAYALVEIIKSRSHQRNFQLVVITHDEDFVELLGRSHYVEEFFKVTRNEDGCSRLVKTRV